MTRIDLDLQDLEELTDMVSLAIGLEVNIYGNTTRAVHIVTIEDPVEYVYRDEMSTIEQREVGQDVLSFPRALRAALRQNPDVILVGEMRDLETIETAILAAETGHLVFSTLHTSTATETVNRIISMFPPHQQHQIRRQLAEVLDQEIRMELQHRKNLRVRSERDGRPGLLGLSHGLERRLGPPLPVHLLPDPAIPSDFQLQPLGEEVDHADTDAVETTGHLVGVRVELSSGVEFGHDDLGGGPLRFLVEIHRDTAPIVAHRHRLVRMDRDLDPIAVPGLRLVHRIVHHFPHHVVQAGDIIHISDVHARTFPNRLEALENLDIVRRVVLLGRRSGIPVLRHSISPRSATGVTDPFSTTNSR